MLKYNFAENLKKLRNINKLSQLELAEKLGVTRQSISYYENGNAEPSISFIIQLSSLFNCSIDSLLFKEHDTDSLDINTLEQIKKAKYLINLNLDIIDSNKIINQLENKKIHLQQKIYDINDLITYMKKYNPKKDNTEFSEELAPSIDFLKKNNSLEEISLMKENTLFILQIKDESMNKLYKNNNYILCNRRKGFTNKKCTCIALVDEELTIKYIENNKDNNTFTLIPYSSLDVFKPVTYSFDEHNLQILGYVIGIIKLDNI